jgi:hypothetical protein
VSDQVSHPNKNNRQYHSSVYLNLYIFGEQTGRQKILHWLIASFPDFNLLLISSLRETPTLFVTVTFSLVYKHCAEIRYVLPP